MSTDKLRALHNTVAEILSEPPSPPSFFDEEPYDAAQVSEQAAKASDNLRRGTEIPKENFGRATPRELGISQKEIREAHVVRDAKNEIPNIAREALTEQTPVAPPADAGNQQRSKLSKPPDPRSDPQTTSINTLRPAASEKRISLGGWGLRGIAGILLAAGIGAALITWLGSSGNEAKTALTAPSQPAPLAQTALTAAVSPEVMPLLQSMPRDLTSVEKEIEQLKVDRELMARDNAKLSEQYKASQEQLTSAVARLSEQLKASQEQVARDNANVAEQIRGIREQLTSVISRASEQNARPKIVATPQRSTLPSPRPAVLPERRPGPILLSPQGAAQPNAEKPKSASTSRPPAPAR